MVALRRVKVSSAKAANLLAAGLGLTFQALDVLVELGAEATQKVTAKTQRVTHEADRRYHEAAERGEALTHKAATDARENVDRVVGITVGWVDREVVQRMAESLKPYLIQELVPDVIDGVLPKVRADVMPVVLADLAEDERVQDMVAAQSKNAATRGLEEIRHTSGDADDRVEDALRGVFGRREPDA
jgi:hypothetical protein